jgi:hypothetical protein
MALTIEFEIQKASKVWLSETEVEVHTNKIAHSGLEK